MEKNLKDISGKRIRRQYFNAPLIVLYSSYSLKSNIIAANKLAVHSNVYEMCFSDLLSAYNLLRELGG